MNAKEFSAGGVVRRDGKLLLVKVTNLKGEQVWTFPKGHLEGKETPLQAALREVEEETGWRCRSKGKLMTVAYKFQRQGRLVDKKVDWFLMEPQEKTGEPDAVEVLETAWVADSDAASKLAYPSDHRLLEKLEAKS
jgi:ADP-ribose pyrophosphatase YjhB (NUDIX family)